MIDRKPELTFQNPALWFGWLSCCLFLNFSFGTGVYASQIFLCGLLTLWIFRKLYHRGASLLPALILVSAFIVWELLVTGGGNRRFVPELTKIVLLAVSSLAIIDILPTEKMTIFTRLIPVLVAGLTASVYLAGAWDYSDPLLHRFGVPAFGSPNTTGYVLSFCLILLHHHLFQDTGTATRLLTLTSYTILGMALVTTQSRGGWLIYLSGLFVMSGKKVRIALVATAGIGIVLTLFTPLGETVSRLNVIVDVRETGGTGRLFIWQQLLQNMFRAPLAIITGMGSGATSFYVAESDTPIESTHSMIIEIFYSYGVAGVVAFAWILKRCWQYAHDRKGAPNPPIVSLKRALLMGLTVSFVLDSYPLTAQILWFTPLLIAIIVVPSAGNNLVLSPQPRALPLDGRTA
jgi:hypothetical protein